ncbi:MAG: hypothetical protein U0232_24055 [Thermomicrobiales bacterium]
MQRLTFAERSRDTYQLRHLFVWLAMCDGMRGESDGQIGGSTGRSRSSNASPARSRWHI